MNSNAGTANTFEAESVSIDITRYISVVLERKRLFIFVAFLVMTMSVIVSYVLPKKYEASCTVFVEQNVINDLVKGIAITPSMDNKIKAIKITMLSRTMLKQVVDDLGLDAGISSAVGLETLIQTLRDDISVRMDEKKGVFVISYTNNDPVRAANVVNTLTRIYIEDNTSSKRQESYEATQFLSEQINIYKVRIDEADKAIDAFKTEAGKYLTKDEVTLRAEIATAEDRLSQIQSQINSVQATRGLLLANSPLKRQLALQTDELTAQRAKYTENHPEVMRVKNLIASTQRLLAQQSEADRQSVYRTQEYQQAKVELESLASIKDNLIKVIAENKAILMMIPTKKTELVELERKKENEVLIYEKLVSRFGQSEVSKEMELQNKSVSFRVLDPAVASSSPVSPKRPLIILAGIVLGIGLGVGLIIGLDLINPSIKSVDAIKKMGLPVFAVVPVIGSVSGDMQRRRSDFLVYIFSGGYFCVILLFLGLETFHLSIVDRVIETLLGFA